MNHKEIERWYRLKHIKRACQILAVVSVAMVVSWYAVSRIWNHNPDDFVSKRVDNQSVHLENFSYSSAGARPWELRADSAAGSQSMDRVSLTRPAVVYTGGAGGKIFLSSSQGELDKTKQNVSARGDVTIRYKDFLFSTDEVHYCHDKLMAETSSQVSLQGPDLHVSGKGLTLSIENEELSVEEDVKTEIFNVRLVGSNGRLPM